MKWLIFTLMVFGCGSDKVVRPIYDCTQIAPEKQAAFDKQVADCNIKESSRYCFNRVQEAYCKPLLPETKGPT